MIRIPKFPLAISALALLLACAIGAQAQRGARTAPRTLDQLTSEADLIVRGSVVSAKVEPHPELKNLTTVVVSMHVDSTLKGSAGKTLEFRQYIWDIRDRIDAARYRKGAEMLLMLGPVSRYGLRSPVGLEQGRFLISRDRTGKVTAVNGAGNVRLLDISDAQLHKSGVKLSSRTATLVREKPTGPLPLSDLEEAIRTFVGGAK